MSRSTLLAAAPGGLLAAAGVTAARLAPTGAADVGALTMGPGRLGATTAVVVALAGVVVGVRALARPAGRVGVRSGRRGAALTLAAAVLALAVGGVVVGTSDAGIGTGNGRGGAYVALVLGAVALVLGLVALTRSARAGRAAA